MALLSDNYHYNKLKTYNINIKTFYISNHNILERNTNNTKNDDIKNGIRCKKEYYKDDKLIHIEKDFDSRIEYSFISKNQEKKDYTCPNCGMHSKIKDFLDGCPYCRTYYNIDYSFKELGSKKHYDRCLRSNTYRIITGIVDVIVSTILCYFFIKYTSRTFNSIDVFKVFIYGAILSLILYYIFYIVDAYIILGPIKNYKDKQNKKQQEFWNTTNLDKSSFFNNFNYEIRKYYYSKEDTIDFDVIDYDEFKYYENKDNEFIDVKAYIRIVYYKNNKLFSKYLVKIFTMKKNKKEKIKLKNGTNIINCSNCGASINIEDQKCNYCGNDIGYFQDWILQNKE